MRAWRRWTGLPSRQPDTTCRSTWCMRQRRTTRRAAWSPPPPNVPERCAHGAAVERGAARGRGVRAGQRGTQRLRAGARVQGLGDLAGLLLGSVSLAVAARADCPVIVVRGGAEYRDSRVGSVVVGVEDGEGSGTAVQFAFREAHVRRCRLVAVHAWSAPFGAAREPPPPSGYALEAHRRSPTQVLEDARALGRRLVADHEPGLALTGWTPSGPFGPCPSGAAMLRLVDGVGVDRRAWDR